MVIRFAKIETMTRQDYYETLGVSKDSSPAEIKSAYRRLAKKYHPDVNKEEQAEQKFKEIGEAYEVLGNEEKRAAYDRLGHHAFDQAARRGGEAYTYPGFDFADIFGGFRDPFDLFEEMFGYRSPFRRTSSVRRESRGEDLFYELTLTFEESVAGAMKEISYPRWQVCDSCQGSGAKKGSRPMVCEQCQGSGRVQSSRSVLGAMFTSVTTCPRCEGEGEVIKNPCESCRGSGRERVTHRFKAKVPAGIEHGMSLRFAGEGDVGERGGTAGDLFLRFKVKPHQFFKRRGDDLYLTIPLAFSQVTLGDMIEVPTIDKKIKLRIPAGTQSNTQFRLKGRGVHHLDDSGRGDQYVRVKVRTPEKLSRGEKRLFEELKELEKKPKGVLNQIFG